MRYYLIALFALVTLGVAVVAPVQSPVLAQDTRLDDSTGPTFDEKSLTDTQKANVALLDEVLGIIRGRFYDRTYGGHDLNDMRARYVQRCANAEAGKPLHDVIREMLGEFKVSHLTLISQEAYENHFAPEMNNTKRRQVGFDLVDYDGEFFVGDILTGGAADKAGLKRGDRVVEMMGAPVKDHPLLLDAGGDPGLPGGHPHYFVRNPVEGVLELKVQRRAEDKELISVSITPSDMNMIQASRNSVGIIEYEGRKFGYIRFWHFLHDGMTSALLHGLRRVWDQCDGLIIDLRGRGGSPMVMNACFAPFGDPPPSRGMGRSPNFNMPKWTRPVVALQDAGSRSAKEVYAHNWKWLEIGPVVGESTPGAVLGSTFVELSDGSQLLYPAQNPRDLSYGRVELEGNPVKPTHEVKDLLPYAAGGDTIKEAGVKVLYELVKDLPPPSNEPVPDDSPEEEEGF